MSFYEFTESLILYWLKISTRNITEHFFAENPEMYWTVVGSHFNWYPEGHLNFSSVTSARLWGKKWIADLFPIDPDCRGSHLFRTKHHIIVVKLVTWSHPPWTGGVPVQAGLIHTVDNDDRYQQEWNIQLVFQVTVDERPRSTTAWQKIKRLKQRCKRKNEII